ncbi:MAG: PSD1 and planctomycete cytochrome C domain-containing protein [Pirellulaceae bacterium]
MCEAIESKGDFASRCLATVCCLVILSSAAVGRAEEAIDFNRDIKPILSDKCYACHGPDAGQRQGGGADGLRFDTEQGAFAELDGKYAIVAGDLEASELVRRITSQNDDEVMPPKDHNKSLSTVEINRLTQWIEQGAVWSQHWAYIPPQPAQVDIIPSPDHSRNWIDQFVLSELARRSLQPSPRADKRTLARRAFFDIIGLPPSPSEMEAFLDDDSPDAYEHLIDRLLASQHFGERLAVYWLDLVRYADTVGYHGDQDVSISPYRDYVISAFNCNMPFDQFTREQLAGDLLPDPTPTQLIASGYNKLGMMSAEGGAQPKEYLTKYASDRVRTASTVWLGSTLGCAECHDHKFDPFTQKDFYQFAAFFADIEERGLYSGANSDNNWGPTIEVPDAELAGLLAPLDEQAAELNQQIAEADIGKGFQNWLAELQATRAAWKTLEIQTAEALHGTQLAPQQDQSLLASGPGSESNTYKIAASCPVEKINGFRLEVLPDETLPKQGPGRAGNGNFVLTEFKAAVIAADGAKRTLVFSNATASIEQADGKNNPYQGWKAAATIDADAKGSKWGWAILPDAGQPHELVVQLKAPVQLAEGEQLEIELEQNHDNPGHTLGRFRLSVTAGTVALDPSHTMPPSIAEAFDAGAAELTSEQQVALEAHYRSIAPELAVQRQELEAIQLQRAEIKARHTRLTLITKTTKPREIRVLRRGNWMDTTGEIVSPQVPHFLPQLETSTAQRATRLDLANWLVDRNNPLTARVFVNRLWKLYFGTGLSKILDDIGSQGEFPSHPKLLDALAIEFMDSGWDIKHMIKLLVMSETYQQSSLMRSELVELDPYNRQLARQSRFRLEAEIVRDNALAVSGLLVADIGGRSVKPYQPAGLLRHLNFPTRTYKHDSGVNQYRRGVYTHWQRQFLHPAMQAFDAPPREECTAERPRSNTPLAALVLLNDPSYVEAARVLTERVMLDGAESDTERINAMFQRALNRPANEAELQVLLPLVASQRKHYAAHPSEAEKFVSTGESPVNPSLNQVDLAATLSAARAIFNMHEFITRN